MQKTLGMAAQGWRFANACQLTASSLRLDAERRARIHTAAMADAQASKRFPRKIIDELYDVEGVIAGHKRKANRHCTIAAAHAVIALEARAEAAAYAKMLIDDLTPELVGEQLSALPPTLTATIKRRFGDDLADPLTRARVFEACDFAQWEGGVDQIALSQHQGIPARGYGR